MAIWGRLINMSPGEVLQLLKVSIRHPRFVTPTIKATRQSIKICDKLFGDDHHRDNRSNAFRHALWNYLICEKCYKVCDSVEKSMEWSKKITDLHEELAPNDELAKTMDLHNNLVGRKLFKKYYSEENLDIIRLLKEKMKKAEKVSTAEQINAQQHQMVYIED
ncbi:MAG TPA: hypothetical protein VIM94_03420 [Salegentibacter sp.]|uniref:DUF6973 domain-containing protein n=1 Tax=Salegentibacter sp. TaxID=1903072 RepID=UPI002F94CCB3